MAGDEGCGSFDTPSVSSFTALEPDSISALLAMSFDKSLDIEHSIYVRNKILKRVDQRQSCSPTEHTSRVLQSAICKVGEFDPNRFTEDF